MVLNPRKNYSSRQIRFSRVHKPVIFNLYEKGNAIFTDNYLNWNAITRLPNSNKG